MQQIPLSQGKFAILDDEDFERLSHYRWFYRAERHGKLGYATRHGSKSDPTKTIYLHRQILDPPPGYECIFLGDNKLDCRRENLRVVTKEESRKHGRRSKVSDRPQALAALPFSC